VSKRNEDLQEKEEVEMGTSGVALEALGLARDTPGYTQRV
jgi:hypothetical protein